MVKAVAPELAEPDPEPHPEPTLKRKYVKGGGATLMGKSAPEDTQSGKGGKKRKRKACIRDGCDKGAEGKTGMCKAHGGFKRCTEEGCDKSARGASDLCSAHGGGKRCTEEGCIRRGEGKTNKCKAHGGGKRCAEEGCDKSAQGASDLCSAHGGGNRCTVDGCGKGARGVTDMCNAHGGGKRCVVDGCGKSAQGASDQCIAHGGGRRCMIKGCSKGATGASGLCIAHGGGTRCPYCVDWPDSRCGNAKKYDGYCATCFKRVFPNDERSTVIYEHSKEIRVRNAINEHFDGFIHDQPLHTTHCDCTMRRRIDHRKLIGGTLLCVETDEFAHRSYDPRDEEIRYDDLVAYHTGRMIFIRFNPDGKGVDMEDKIERLLDEMRCQIERTERGENDGPGLLEIIYLYYNKVPQTT